MKMENEFSGKILYYYCPLDAFVSIIKNKQLWLSCVEDTNDKLELDYASHLVRQFAKKIGKENPELQQKCNDLIAAYKKDDWYDSPYIACFSGKGHNLSQWRLYADDAKGMAIGFSGDKLQEKLEINIGEYESILKAGYRGYKVKYANKKYKDQLYENIKDKLTKKGMICMDNLDRRLLTEELCLKDEVFKFEDEYRILYYPKLSKRDESGTALEISKDMLSTKKIDFRIRDGKLVSYFKMPIDGCIESVRLGPKCDCSKSVIQKFLTACGFADVLVKKDSAPYR